VYHIYTHIYASICTDIHTYIPKNVCVEKQKAGTTEIQSLGVQEAEYELTLWVGEGLNDEMKEMKAKRSLVQMVECCLEFPLGSISSTKQQT
jgi:hypothetical protein